MERFYNMKRMRRVILRYVREVKADVMKIEDNNMSPQVMAKLISNFFSRKQEGTDRNDRQGLLTLDSIYQERFYNEGL